MIAFPQSKNDFREIRSERDDALHGRWNFHFAADLIRERMRNWRGLRPQRGLRDVCLRKRRHAQQEQ